MINAMSKHIRQHRDNEPTPESIRAFYERRLQEEWESVGGTVHGPFFSHPKLPGFSGDSRSCWKYLVFRILATS